MIGFSSSQLRTYLDNPPALSHIITISLLVCCTMLQIHSFLDLALLMIRRTEYYVPIILINTGSGRHVIEQANANSAGRYKFCIVFSKYTTIKACDKGLR